MKLLLDTHIWLWSLSEPERLRPRLLRELDNFDNQLWLSSVSVWEALVLDAKGRIELPADIAEWVAESTSRFREAPLTHEIVVAAPLLKLSHSDPADRFLAATAKVLDLTLVTADQKLLTLTDVALLPNS